MPTHATYSESPGVAVRDYFLLSSLLFHVLTDRSDYSAHGNDGATVELSSWAADNEASIRRGHGGEEGVETCGLGDVHSALVP